MSNAALLSAALIVLQNVYWKRSGRHDHRLVAGERVMCGKFALKKVGSRVKNAFAAGLG